MSHCFQRTLRIPVRSLTGLEGDVPLSLSRVNGAAPRFPRFRKPCPSAVADPPVLPFPLVTW
eukprot:1338231-Heterocapsa_arctica.AAC.1